MSDTAEITDAEIRDWARATGRDVNPKGHVKSELRREYERLNSEANSTPPEQPSPAAADPEPPPAGAGARGSQIESKGPGPAAQETPPRRTRPRGSSLRGRARRWFSGSAPARRRPPRKSSGPRVSCERLIAGAWEGSARLLQPVNLPLSRCLAWQGSTAGPVLDGAIQGTFIDAVVQPFARWGDRIGTVADFVGPPGFVVALQLPANQPFRRETLRHPDGQVLTDDQGRALTGDVPWPAGAIRQQLLMTGLAQSLARCAERQEQLPEAVREQQVKRERRLEDMRQVIEMFFAPPQSAGPAGAAAEEEAMRAAREYLRGD